MSRVLTIIILLLLALRSGGGDGIITERELKEAAHQSPYNLKVIERNGEITLAHRQLEKQSNRV